MNDCPKFQYSKFSPDRSEQWVIRTDLWDELVEYRSKTLEIIPKGAAFPNDEGPMVTPQSQVQTPAPVCQVHQVPMNLKPAGVSKTGRAYPAFWSCGVRNGDGGFCTYRAK